MSDVAFKNPEFSHLSGCSAGAASAELHLHLFFRAFFRNNLRSEGVMHNILKYIIKSYLGTSCLCSRDTKVAHLGLVP